MNEQPNPRNVLPPQVAKSAPYDSITCAADTIKSVEKTNASEPLIAHKAVPMLGSI